MSRNDIESRISAIRSRFAAERVRDDERVARKGKSRWRFPLSPEGRTLVRELEQLDSMLRGTPG